MGRGCGLFLLACGIVGGIVGVGGTTLAVLAGGFEVAFFFAFVAVCAIVALVIAVRVLRRTTPIGMETTGAGTPDYPAGGLVARDLDGTAYDLQYTPPVTGKHARPSVLTFRTAVGTAGEFELVQETEFDRLCKRLGLAVEVETGDAAFDEGCYVRSDKPEFAAAYLADPLKRTAVLDLRRFGFHSVVLKGGMLSVTRIGFDPGAHGGAEFDAEVAARLVLLARNVPADSPEFVDRAAGRRMWQAVLWLLLVGFGLTALALFAYPAVRTVDLVWRAAVVLLTWPVFGLVAARLLRGTSRSHLAWSGVMFGSLFLYPLGSLGSVALVNGAADASAGAVHRVAVTEKYTTKSKKTVNYHVRCGSWRPDGGTHSFGVSQQTYNAVVPNRSEVVVTTRAGALGVEWQRSFRVEPTPGK